MAFEEFFFLRDTAGNLGRTRYIGGDPHESRILAGYYVFNANISVALQAIKNLYAHFTYLCFGPL